MQTFTVPAGVTNLTISAKGAQGGSVSTACVASGGLGAHMVGDFGVAPGEALSILVGQQGQSNGQDGGGGGGSFVVRQSSTAPLVIAGGGGGATNNILGCGSNLNGMDASITNSGTASADGVVAGGAGGGGGGANRGTGGGGGGFLTNGVAGDTNPGGNGKSFLNGGAGGTPSGGSSDGGGYGGGGAGWYTGGNGGGGGGYSGGGTNGNMPFSGGGGGGSLNAGDNQINTAGVQAGNGEVSITWTDEPGAPTGVTATSGNAQLSLAFSPPTHIGSSEITAYTATCTPAAGGAAVIASGMSSPIVVTSLTNGTAYNCTVTASNAVGSGPASSPVAPGTPLANVPGAPTGVTATAGNAQISLAFTAPADTGGSPITSYSASCTPSGGGTALTAQGSASPVVVAGLTNGTAYDCAVTASNVAGAGAASTSVAATPRAPVPALAPTAVPSLSEWGLMLMGLVAAGLGMRRLRHQQS
ncbi:IPTL-CTERM sorting domain-containing protein [Ottowia thiooxydans]